MRRAIIFTLLFVRANMAISSPDRDDPKYKVSDIPEHLRAGVYAVVRLDQSEFIIHSESRCTHHVRMAVTIFSDQGKRFASQTIGYDKLSKITSFKGTAYDAAGNVIKRLKTNEIYDQSAFDGFSLYSDNRLKHADLSHGAYPYTVEFEYEVESKKLFFIPSNWIGGEEKVSVEKFSYSLTYPTSLPARYKTYNFDAQAKIERNGDRETITWTADNILPSRFEPFGPRHLEVIPRIAAAPSKFQFDDYPGDMSTWNKFGEWIASLNRDRNTVSEKTKLEVLGLTANQPSVEGKVKAIYEFMQSKTRYVSIQLGIGGFQPFEAQVVDQTGYGDCKALSNYMVSLLGAAGIKANYALISAGIDYVPLDESFPSSQFNHAVAFVPNGMDTIWLECTSQTNPFGYTGHFTGERKALAITDQGAKVVHTPRFAAEQNIQTNVANVDLGTNGDAQARIRSTYSGLQYESNGLSYVLDNNYDEQKKWIEENTKIPSFDLQNFKMSNQKKRNPTAEVKLDLVLRKYGSLSNKRIFIVPNLMNRSTYVPERLEQRHTAIVRKMAFIDIDTIRYKIPESIYPESLPPSQNIKTRFGQYESSIRIDQGELIYVRKLRMEKGTFPAESYGELVEFYKSISKADNAKLVFLSKT